MRRRHQEHRRNRLRQQHRPHGQQRRPADRQQLGGQPTGGSSGSETTGSGSGSETTGSSSGGQTTGSSGASDGTDDTDDTGGSLCIQTGGTEGTSLCCMSSGDFPDTCLIGACGCAPDDSHEVKSCSCPGGKCYDATMGCIDEML